MTVMKCKQNRNITLPTTKNVLLASAELTFFAFELHISLVLIEAFLPSGSRRSEIHPISLKVLPWLWGA